MKLTTEDIQKYGTEEEKKLLEGVFDFLDPNAIDHSRKEQRRKQYEDEIEWLENELNTKKLTPKQRGEYLHQIKHKKLKIAFEDIQKYGTEEEQEFLKEFTSSGAGFPTATDASGNHAIDKALPGMTATKKKKKKTTIARRVLPKV